jgi:Mlc titration factor MtfA (ptsG expression regulator)
MPNLVNKIIGQIFGRDKKTEESITETDPPLPIATEYATLIGAYIPYFNRLTEEEKRRFIKRAWHFRQSKTFHFSGLTEQEEIAVLISAASVQLTFGLKGYRLEFFKDIHVMPDAYQWEPSQPLYIGHVAPGVIYISWKHFLQGYADVSDSLNVAIHEMAHALHYHKFLEEAKVDWEFRKDFEQLPGVFGPSMAGVIVNRRSYLRTYAYTNIQEFWAVSVEAFFENPNGLSENMPALYRVISEILNQNPQVQNRTNTVS